MSTEYVVALRSRPQRVELATELRARYESGTSIRALAGSTHLAYGTVRRLLIEADTTLRPRGGAYHRSMARADLAIRIRDALELLGDTLPQHLLNAAKLRLDYPEASLVQLAAATRPPVSAVAVYDRLSTVVRLAEGARRISANQRVQLGRAASAAVRVPDADE